MSDGKSDWDVTIAVLLLVVFLLPMTLMLPDFNLWEFVPKTRVYRFHILSQHVTWSHLNAAVITLLGIFFCLYLEIRKRKLDDLVEDVLTVSQVTDDTMEEEKQRQAIALKACVDLLDSSSQQYEKLALLHDDVRKRALLQRPPAVELSYASCLS